MVHWALRASDDLDKHDQAEVGVDSGPLSSKGPHTGINSVEHSSTTLLAICEGMHL